MNDTDTKCGFWQPWMIAPGLIGGLLLLLLVEPVFIHYFGKWWDYWLPMKELR